MSLFSLIILFFLGACIGSFSAVLLGEKDPNRPFWTGRSHCLGCKKTLAWYELIPLVSYALQKGKCRTCQASIPRWIWYMEWYMAFLWMVSAMLLSYAGFGAVAIGLHIFILTALSLLVIEDIRSHTIPDSMSMPVMGALFVIFATLAYYSHPFRTLLPDASNAIIGAFLGMGFYMLQMILPALWETIRCRRYGAIFSILISPFIFPVWIVVKAFLGEKTADRLCPTLQVFDDLPSWVGGGDIRLGIIIGALMGPFAFLPVVMYGYLAGTIFFVLRYVISHEKMKTMPVAPLLFIGLCVVWILRIIA